MKKLFSRPSTLLPTIFFACLKASAGCGGVAASRSPSSSLLRDSNSDIYCREIPHRFAVTLLSQHPVDRHSLR